MIILSIRVCQRNKINKTCTYTYICILTYKNIKFILNIKYIWIVNVSWRPGNPESWIAHFMSPWEGRALTFQLKLSGRKDKLSLSLPFYSNQALSRLEEAHVQWERQSTLFHLTIPMLNLSENTLTDRPRNISPSMI